MKNGMLKAPPALLAAVLLSSCCAKNEVPSESEPAPSVESAPAKEIAARAGFRIVEFGAESCKWCQELRKSFQEINESADNKLAFEYVDLKHQKDRNEQARRAGFEGFVPFTVIYGPSGDVKGTFSGYIKPDDLAVKLKETGAVQ